MNIILGASGQIGSLIVQDLKGTGEPVKAIVRKAEARVNYLNSGIECEIADLLDLKSIKQIVNNGKTLFVLTPENPQSNDIFADAKKILDNIKKAITDSGIKRLVGLSSFGAQHSHGTGNLSLSYLLEHSFTDLPVETVFIRPAYYYSNWLEYYDAIKAQGVLPTFFPPDLKIPMVAPTNVATFIADIIRQEETDNNIIEISGPTAYSSTDIAKDFGKILQKDIDVESIPEHQWKDNFLQFGATENYSNAFAEMTKAVIEGKAIPSDPNRVIRLSTFFADYLHEMIRENVGKH